MRDWLLLTETVWPTMRAYHLMPRDREDDLAVFLCHGIQLTKVPTSPLAQKMTPAHRQRFGCPVCRRSFSLDERRRDLEILFAAEQADRAFLIVRREGIGQGWYDPNQPVTLEEEARVVRYKSGELLPPEPTFG
jgi:hypothetical protein